MQKYYFPLITKKFKPSILLFFKKPDYMQKGFINKSLCIIVL